MPETLYGVALVPLIIGVVALLKTIPGFPEKWSGVFAAAIGLGIGLVYYQPDYMQGTVVGLALGLSASGLYSTTKNASGN